VESLQGVGEFFRRTRFHGNGRILLFGLKEIRGCESSQGTRKEELEDLCVDLQASRARLKLKIGVKKRVWARLSGAILLCEIRCKRILQTCKFI
jgi:hypothetical protein